MYQTVSYWRSCPHNSMMMLKLIYTMQFEKLKTEELTDLYVTGLDINTCSFNHWALICIFTAFLNKTIIISLHVILLYSWNIAECEVKPTTTCDTFFLTIKFYNFWLFVLVISDNCFPLWSVCQLHKAFLSQLQATRWANLLLLCQ